MSDTGTAITLKKVRGREGATSFRRGSERGAELPSRAPRGPSSSRALIAVPSLDEPREFVRSWRLESLPDSAARVLQEAYAAASPSLGGLPAQWNS